MIYSENLTYDMEYQLFDILQISNKCIEWRLQLTITPEKFVRVDQFSMELWAIYWIWSKAGPKSFCGDWKALKDYWSPACYDFIALFEHVIHDHHWSSSNSSCLPCMWKFISCHYSWNCHPKQQHQWRPSVHSHTSYTIDCLNKVIPTYWYILSCPQCTLSIILSSLSTVTVPVYICVLYSCFSRVSLLLTSILCGTAPVYISMSCTVVLVWYRNFSYHLGWCSVHTEPFDFHVLPDTSWNYNFCKIFSLTLSKVSLLLMRYRVWIFPIYKLIWKIT